MTSIPLLFFIGCSFGPSPEELASAYYGEYPENYEQVIRDFATRIAVDPDPNSVHLKFEEPVKGYMQNQNDPFSKREFGWLVKTQINAKNRYGGYAGDRPWEFLIRDGQILLMRSIDIQGYYAKPSEW